MWVWLGIAAEKKETMSEKDSTGGGGGGGVGVAGSPSVVVPVTITRGLTDKLVEKRKGAALELERQGFCIDLCSDLSSVIMCGWSILGKHFY